MSEFISCSLEGIRFCVIMIDGIVVAKRSVIVVLGVDDEGKKYPLGLRLGSTENATVCAELLQELLERGLSVQSRMLFVIDGAKGIRKAVIDVFGTNTLIQRCRNHKLRNVRDHLAKHRHAYVMRAMREAYQSQTAETARKHLKTLLSWLESNGESKAASSLREGLEETLTVHKLRLPQSLRSCLGTTNLIENLMGTIRRTCRNVKRWKNGDMVTRWTALAISTAQRKFRRIQGYRDLALLIAELDKRTGNLDNECVAA
jgi:putative transposase